MCTKPFSQTKNKEKLYLVAKSSGPLLARMPLKTSREIFSLFHSALNLLPNCISFIVRSWIVIETDDWHPPKTHLAVGKKILEGRVLEKTTVKTHSNLLNELAKSLVCERRFSVFI